MEKEIEQAARLMLASKYVVGLTGAGISVESGIRPFRGPGGLWTERGEPPMDGYRRFLADPKSHWEQSLSRSDSTADFRQTLETAVPNLAHYAMAELEELGVLKYLITQNVDDLHRISGSKKLAEIHGNYRRLRCTVCNSRFEMEDVSLDTLPPCCPRCRGLIKSDTVMFGEPIPRDVLQVCQEETDKSDCMLLVGTSALVYPAAGFPQQVKMSGGKLIEVNPYETELTFYCDVVIRGKAGEGLPRLVDAVKRALKQS